MCYQYLTSQETKGRFSLGSRSKTLGVPNTTLWTLLWTLKITLKLEDRFLKLGRVSSWERTAEIWQKRCHISTTSIFHTLDPDPSINSLGPEFSSWPIGSLDFGVFLVLDPSVKATFSDGPPPNTNLISSTEVIEHVQSTKEARYFLPANKIYKTVGWEIKLTQ